MISESTCVLKAVISVARRVVIQLARPAYLQQTCLRGFVSSRHWLHVQGHRVGGAGARASRRVRFGFFEAELCDLFLVALEFAIYITSYMLYLTILHTHTHTTLRHTHTVTQAHTSTYTHTILSYLSYPIDLRRPRCFCGGDFVYTFLVGVTGVASPRLIARQTALVCCA